MPELGVYSEGIPGGLIIDLPEEEIWAHPDDLAIPHLLLNDSEERELSAQGQQASAYRIHQQRRRLYRIWIEALRRQKVEIHAVRLRSGQFPFSEVVRFEWRITRGLLLLRAIGWLHFAGVTRRGPRTAVETARGLTAAGRSAPAY